MPRSPPASPHYSSDRYSESSSISSTRSIIKPATPTSISPPSRVVAFTEDEATGRRGDDGWKMDSRKGLSNLHNNASPRSFWKTPTDVIHSQAPIQGSGAEPPKDNGGAVVLGCTQFLRTGSCAYGDACKYSHVSIALSATQRTSSEHKQHHTTAAAAAEKENESASTYESLPRETKRAIDHLLRKTKICHAFNKGKCDYGYACRFAHIAGHDAFQILSKANAAKDCPFQVVLGQCSTTGKGCYFKHSPLKGSNSGKGKKTITTMSTKSRGLQVREEEDGREASAGSGSGSGSEERDEVDDEFAREINDLIDFREALKDVRVSRE